MFCYYNYLIVFGGEGENGVVLGDLWLYDIVKRTWHNIMDAANIHQLTHQNVTGIIPAPRVFAAGEVNERFGAAFVSGG